MANYEHPGTVGARVTKDTPRHPQTTNILQVRYADKQKCEEFIMPHVDKKTVSAGEGAVKGFRAK